MTAMTFDALRYFEKLKEAGVPEAKAKAQAEVQAEAMKDFVASRELATKGDLLELKQATKGDLLDLELRLTIISSNHILLTGKRNSCSKMRGTRPIS